METINPKARTTFRVPLVVRYLLYAFTFSLNFEYWEFLNIGSFTITKTIGILLFVVTLLYSQKVLFKPDPSAWALLFIWLWSAIASVLNAYSNDELFDVFTGPLFTLLQCLCLFWIIQNFFHDKKTLINTLMAFAFGCFIIALLMFLGFGVKSELQRNGFERLSLFGFNPNDFGLYMVLCVVIVMSVVLENPSKLGDWRFLLLFGVPIVLKAAFASGSRGALVALVLGLATFSFARRSARKQLLVWGVMTAMGALIVLYISNSDIQLLRWQSTIESGDSAGRSELWLVAFEKISEKPFSGWGFTGMSRCFQQISDGFDPHNAFLAMFMLAGVVGGFLFLAITSWWLLQAFEARRTILGCLPLALVTVVLSVFIKGGSIYMLKIVWVMLACVAPMRRYWKSCEEPY
ncbi:MAG: O-antigen ligase family protein [Verrucomicrobiota bacterium]